MTTRKEYRNLKGELHRENGPAIEWTSGTKEWWLNGKRHREDGPAIERTNGTKVWYLNDEELTEEEFNARTQVKELSIAELEEMLGFKIKVVGE